MSLLPGTVPAEEVFMNQESRRGPALARSRLPRTSARPTRSLLQAVLGLALLSIVSSHARAHRVDVTAHAEGETIVGRAEYAGGQPVAEADVVVRDPTGQIIARAKTDTEGRFRFPAAGARDHLIVVDAGAGHAGRAVVEAAVLSSEGVSATGPSTQPSSPDESPHRHETIQEQLHLVRQQLTQLQQQLDARERQTRFRDVLGGIGYILGVTGVLFYFLGARRNRRES